MDNIETGVSTPEGLPRGEMDKLMNELLTNREAGQGNEPGKGAGGEWDQLTLLTGGFVPVGSIFWARPPKLFSHQKIWTAIDAADKAAKNPDQLQGMMEQSNILLDLACQLFFVQEEGKFVPATREQIGGDDAGLDVIEIRDAFFRLMGVNIEEPAQGNAQSLPTT